MGLGIWYSREEVTDKVVKEIWLSQLWVLETGVNSVLVI